MPTGANASCEATSASLSPHDLDRMIRSYYRARGWTDDGSVPPERVSALGLEPLS